MVCHADARQPGGYMPHAVVKGSDTMKIRIMGLLFCTGILALTATLTHAGDTRRSSSGFKVSDNESPRPQDRLRKQNTAPLPGAPINTTRSNIKRPGVAVGDVNGDGRADLRKGGKTGGNNRNNALTDGLIILR